MTARFHGLRTGLLSLPLILAAAGAALAQAGPMPVTVAKPVERTVVETADFTGRFQAWPSVQVNSRVTGYLDKAEFVEGAYVKEGDVLFTIDPRPFQAAVDQAAGQLKGAETRLDLARTNLTRSEELRKTGNTTDASYQANQQAFLEAGANIESAKAALSSAKLDLEFATIKAPIAGKIGRKLISPGNIVVANSTSPLTTIVSTDPLYFYFDIDETSYLLYRRLNGESDTGQNEPTQAKIALPDETTFDRPATLDYLDPQVDTDTGTVTARALVDNKDGFLTPGLFGRIRMIVAPPYKGLVVPDAAVGTSGAGNFVVALGADDTAAIKPVTIGPKYGTFRVIKSGLTADDRVVVNGLMRAAPGAKVIPQPTELTVPENLADADRSSTTTGGKG
jgi:RND family efflux transporter MFP subunit